MTSFEGSFLGDKQRIGDGAVMECGVCWWTYDPQLGDAVWHVPPNTPFSQLPSHWRCPNCDAAPHQFMTLDEGTSPRPETRQPAPTAGVAKLEDIAENCGFYSVDTLINSFRTAFDTTPGKYRKMKREERTG